MGSILNLPIELLFIIFKNLNTHELETLQQIHPKLASIVDQYKTTSEFIIKNILNKPIWLINNNDIKLFPDNIFDDKFRKVTTDRSFLSFGDPIQIKNSQDDEHQEIIDFLNNKCIVYRKALAEDSYFDGDLPHPMVNLFQQQRSFQHHRANNFYSRMRRFSTARPNMNFFNDFWLEHPYSDLPIYSLMGNNNSRGSFLINLFGRTNIQALNNDFQLPAITRKDCPRLHMKVLHVNSTCKMEITTRLEVDKEVLIENLSYLQEIRNRRRLTSFYKPQNFMYTSSSSSSKDSIYFTIAWYNRYGQTRINRPHYNNNDSFFHNESFTCSIQMSFFDLIEMKHRTISKSENYVLNQVYYSRNQYVFFRPQNLVIEIEKNKLKFMEDLVFTASYYEKDDNASYKNNSDFAFVDLVVSNEAFIDFSFIDLRKIGHSDFDNINNFWPGVRENSLPDHLWWVNFSEDEIAID